MRAHVADGDGPARGVGGGHGGGSRHISGTDAAGEPAPDLVGGVQLAPGERAGPGDERTGTVVTQNLGLEQPEHPLDAVRSPRGDEPSVGFAQRLGRCHHASVTTRRWP